jgi:hypothetical protein
MRPVSRFLRSLLFAASLIVAVGSTAAAPLPAQPAATIDTAALKGLRTRLLGPYRGGRSTAVTGVPHRWWRLEER